MVWYLRTDAGDRSWRAVGPGSVTLVGPALLVRVAVVTQRWMSEGRILPIGRFPKVGMKCLSR